ncbi:protein of unknown function [Streptomyces sp. KY75]|nr:protein of unknown function [Streptomyces sp. KY70]CAD5991034.1 protein of unknown function [Streptomyces sp. KY75]
MLGLPGVFPEVMRHGPRPPGTMQLWGSDPNERALSLHSQYEKASRENRDDVHRRQDRRGARRT